LSEFLFRNLRGAEEASALFQVHADCPAMEGSDPLSPHAYRPSLAWFRERLDHVQPADWIIVEGGGTVIGYGRVIGNWAERDETHIFMHAGWVAPQWRGRGVGTQLLLRLEARCRDVAQGIPAAGYEYAYNAQTQEPGAYLDMERHGYTLAYTSWEMELDPGFPVTVAPLPDGYELRPVIPDHHRAIWQCIGDAYDVSCPSGRFTVVPTEAAFEDHFRREAADPTLWAVAWQGSRVAGQVLCRVHKRCAEVREVSIGYGHRRRGLGQALLTRGLAALRKREVSTIRLGTRYENPTQAWRLYEQVGFRRVGAFPCWRKSFAL
jgi:mycothiol synthase